MGSHLREDLYDHYGEIGEYLPPTPSVLRRHPNLHIPDMPVYVDIGSVIDYVIDSAAHFVSPPKVEGEDVEFRCEDVARAIREDFRALIWAKIARPLDGMDLDV